MGGKGVNMRLQLLMIEMCARAGRGAGGVRRCARSWADRRARRRAVETAMTDVQNLTSK